jgi:hypothetical protein
MVVCISKFLSDLVFILFLVSKPEYSLCTRHRRVFTCELLDHEKTKKQLNHVSAEGWI